MNRESNLLATNSASEGGETPGPAQSDKDSAPVTLMAASRLVLSLFPGAGLLDRGFHLAGWCVVRGPDTLLGQDIREFHAGPGHFAGVIGGPPCQDFSRARRRPPSGYGLKMIQEFARVVTEADPDWWLMENVPGVPDVHVAGYLTQRFNTFACHFGLRQRRNRAFQFGSKNGLPLVLERSSESHFGKLAKAVLARDGRRNFADLCELQGLPRSFDLPGLSRSAKYRAVGNGVPVPVAFSIAAAIRDRRVTDQRLCACHCGRPVTGRQISATPACRKRLERVRTLEKARSLRTIGLSDAEQDATDLGRPGCEAGEPDTILPGVAGTQGTGLVASQRSYGALQLLTGHSTPAHSTGKLTEVV